MAEDLYKNPICITQQFRFCGNPFRIDMYRGCDFGCRYCFANARQGNFKVKWQTADIKIIERAFHKAFEDEKEYKNVTVELMRHKVPMHCGGMSDPFQAREWDIGATKKLIELSNKYDYPISFSTKAAYLPEEYYNVLNPNIHAFQISLMGYDEDFVRKYESNTPSPAERIEFCKELKRRGFWVSCRIQPMIDVEQARKVIEALNDTVDYFTVEHLKIPVDNKFIRAQFEPIDKTRYTRTSSLRSYELNKPEKVSNIEYLKKISKKPIGCGDNDIHYLSDSRCCCGVDMMPESFKNYMKYNLTYFCTGECNPDELWTPSCSVRNIFNSDTQIKGVDSLKDYTDIYCKRYNYFFGEDNPHNFYKEVNP